MTMLLLQIVASVSVGAFCGMLCGTIASDNMPKRFRWRTQRVLAVNLAITLVVTICVFNLLGGGAA